MATRRALRARPLPRRDDARVLALPRIATRAYATGCITALAATTILLLFMPMAIALIVAVAALALSCAIYYRAFRYGLHSSLPVRRIRIKANAYQGADRNDTGAQ